MYIVRINPLQCGLGAKIQCRLMKWYKHPILAEAADHGRSQAWAGGGRNRGSLDILLLCLTMILAVEGETLCSSTLSSDVGT